MEQRVNNMLAAALAATVWVSASADTLKYVDSLIGTEGSGSQYGGMQPYTCVPFGSFHMVPMTRLNRVESVGTDPACDGENPQ